MPSSPSYDEIYFKITQDLSYMRLDQALSFHPKILTRSQSTHLIRKGLVNLLSKESEEKTQNVKSFPIKSSRKTVRGEIYKISLPLKKPQSLQAFNHPLDLFMEDENVIVLNKPSGLVVHPSTNHESNTLVNILIYHKKKLSLGFGKNNRPGIVHRLDKETSGLLVIAKNNESHLHLSHQFKNRSVSRKYWALVYGKVLSYEGSLSSYIKRHPKNRKKFINYKFHHFLDSKKALKEISTNKVTKEKGKWAMTHYKKIAESDLGFSLLECQLETGRTHQIRTHFLKAGFPIVGDKLYGHQKFFNQTSPPELKKSISSLNRIGLHAFEISFNHPKTDKSLTFKCDWPSDLFPLLKLLKLKKLS